MNNDQINSELTFANPSSPHFKQAAIFLCVLMTKIKDQRGNIFWLQGRYQFCNKIRLPSITALVIETGVSKFNIYNFTHQLDLVIYMY